MAFKAGKQSSVSLDSPEALFRDLRQRTIPAPHAHQADVLRDYVRLALNRPDVALQLPTGSGKTLVGLLIGEWRRRKRGERVVYLCPTNQLVHQVVEHAVTKYGIEARAFVGSKAGYDQGSKTAYQAAECVAVTSYSALFNVNPFFEDPQLIVLDDAHAADNYIAAHWSVRIERFRRDHAPLFSALAGVLSHVLTPIDARRLTGEWHDLWDKTWVDKIPTPIFSQVADEIAAVMDAHVATMDLRYSWGILRGSLHACHLYVGASEILIRPLLPPTRTHPPFASATQRLYMSATLGEGGDLERIAGVPEIFRLPAPPGWDKQGIGRRFFVFPGRSLSRSDEEELHAQMIDAAGRVLVLVPDEGTAEGFREWARKRLGIPTFDARQIEVSKAEFVSAKTAAAVVANRYDGIDFPRDECRLLIVEGLPRATNLQERFLVTKMGAISLLNDRILTRVVQAFGRCTRDATDYAAVVVSGDELLTYLLTRERREFLHPELQAEIEFGINESKDITSDEFMENLRAFLGQTKVWQQAEGTILTLRQGLRQSRLPGTEDLRKAVSHEIDYQYALWFGDHVRALAAARRVLGVLNAPDLRGYRALWLYLAGSAAWLQTATGKSDLSASVNEYFREAKKAAPAVHWLTTLVPPAGRPEEVEDQSLLMSVIERLEVQLAELGMLHDRRFAEEEQFILQNVALDSSRDFEAAHERLGRLLGYEAGNIETPGAPDPWWITDEHLCFIFEDYSEAKARSALDVTKARQVATHPNWARTNLPIAKDARIIPVLISRVRKADKDALPHLKGVAYWSIDAFREWTRVALVAIRDLRREFPGTGDLAWRAQAAERYRRDALGPQELLKLLESQPATRALVGPK